MSKWWNTDMAAAAQALNSDPATAVQAATLPAILLKQQEAYKKQQEEYLKSKEREDEEEDRLGWIKGLSEGIMNTVGKVDNVLSEVPGWGVTKEAVGYPVDKLVSGMHWAYSEILSQPLSTLLLSSAEAELSDDYLGTMFKGETWSKNYGEAEHISPGQAFTNYENVASAVGEPGALASVFGGGAENLTPEQKEAVKRNSTRYLYDTDFWHEKQGWTYTLGSGGLDFFFIMAGDPTYLAVKATMPLVKGGRNLTTTQKADTGETVTTLGQHSLTDVAASTNMQKFADWVPGKIPEQIAAHPIWGVGRRKNPHTAQYAQLLAGERPESVGLIARFAGGDSAAMREMATNSENLTVKIGRVQDNRVLVDSTKFDPDILAHYAEAERIFPRQPAPLDPAIAGRVTPEELKLHEEAARGAVTFKTGGLKPMRTSTVGSKAFAQRAEAWRVEQLNLIDKELAHLTTTDNFYQKILGENYGLHGDELTAAGSNLFGTMDSFHRMGPLALRNTEKLADKRWNKMTSGRSLAAPKKGPGAKALASRVIRTGMYSTPVRIFQSFGDEVPEKFIDHSAADATERVINSLRGVKGLPDDVRRSMIQQYSTAGDKIARADTLKGINTAIVEHMAAQRGIDGDTARVIADQLHIKLGAEHSKITGVQNTAERFGTLSQTDAAGNIKQAVDPVTGHRIDAVVDGEAWIIAPLAKTQLSRAEPMLDVKELGRALDRSAGFIKSTRARGADAKDIAVTLGDHFSSVWKLGTLMRPGYVIRNVTEASAAAAAKFSAISVAANLGKGSVNWFGNRGRQIAAFAGGGPGYMPTTGKALSSQMGRVKLDDAAQIARFEGLGLPTTRINVPNSVDYAEGVIKNERALHAEAEAAREGVLKEIAKKTKKDPGFVATPAGQKLQRDLDFYKSAMDDHAEVIREYSDYAGAVIRQAEKAQGKRLGHGEYEYRGIKIPEAFSDKWENPIVADEITSKYGNQVMFSRYEAISKERLAKTGSWVDITPNMPNHMDEWLRAINLQFGQDDLFRMVAEDPNKAEAWVKTADGRRHLSLLGPHGKEPEELIRKIELLLDQYVPAQGGIRDKFIRGEEVFSKDLNAAMPQNAFPVVHGEEVKALLGRERHLTASAMVDEMIAKSFGRFATIPTDILANHPIYLMAQRARMKELVDKEMAFRLESGLDETITAKDLNNMLSKSDQLARKDITQVVYDPTRTSATEGLRFAAPFLSAHIDGLQRWSGLIAEKPQLLSRISQIYNAPVAANMITDKNGNHVDQSGYASIKDADGKIIERKFVPLPDRVFHLRWPGQNPDKQSKGDIPIALNAMNVILPGDPWFNPGGGPLIQVGGNVLAKQVPAAGEFLQWAKALPFGPTDTATAITPKWMREAYTAWTAGDQGNEKYQSALLAVYNKQMADWHKGGGKGAKPTFKQAEKEAKSFMFLEALTAFATPAQTMQTPLTGTPYQFYIDQYKQLQDVDPENAKDIFWSRYGEDYYHFTTSMSKSMGIAPTIEAVYTSEEYKDMIEMDPDLAGFIMSQRDKGEFSSTAYAVQMDQLIGGERVRSKLTAEQAAKLNEAQAGWEKYSKMMNLVDSMLLKVGFKSYEQKGAEKFALLKTAVMNQVAEQYPAWDEDFSQVDMGKVPRRIESLSRLVMDPRLANDPLRTDVKVMQQYLMVRAVFKQKLTSMGLKQLSYTPGAGPTQEGAPAQGTGEAKALANQWRMVQMGFVNQNTQFGDMFHRYLSNDNLQ